MAVTLESHGAKHRLYFEKDGRKELIAENSQNLPKLQEIQRIATQVISMENQIEQRGSLSSDQASEMDLLVTNLLDTYTSVAIEIAPNKKDQIYTFAKKIRKSQASLRKRDAKRRKKGLVKLVWLLILKIFAKIWGSDQTLLQNIQIYQEKLKNKIKSLFHFNEYPDVNPDEPEEEIHPIEEILSLEEIRQMQEKQKRIADIQEEKDFLKTYLGSISQSLVSFTAEPKKRKSNLEAAILSMNLLIDVFKQTIYISDIFPNMLADLEDLQRSINNYSKLKKKRQTAYFPIINDKIRALDEQLNISADELEPFNIPPECPIRDEPPQI